MRTSGFVGVWGTYSVAEEWLPSRRHALARLSRRTCHTCLPLLGSLAFLLWLRLLGSVVQMRLFRNLVGICPMGGQQASRGLKAQEFGAEHDPPFHPAGNDWLSLRSITTGLTVLEHAGG